MKNIAFKNIFKGGQPVLENDLYVHIHNPEMLLQYDSNFIEFKKMPVFDEFKKAESYLRVFHEKYGQKHLRFYFPEGERLTTELMKNLLEDYTVSFLELFAIRPSDFPKVNDHPDIKIQMVTTKTLDTYLKFQYKLDSQYGNAYAEQKQGHHLRNFNSRKVCQIISLYKGRPAGVVDVIISDQTVEIDGLVVDEEFQKMGIGSRLQKFVMEQFKEKIVILVADGDDTPKEMYRKQNYQYLGYQYNALRLFGTEGQAPCPSF